MTRRDWWVGIIVLSAALLAHGLMNRYSWQVMPVPGSGHSVLIRIDSLTGRLNSQPLTFQYGELATTRFEPSAERRVFTLPVPR